MFGRRSGGTTPPDDRRGVHQHRAHAEPSVDLERLLHDVHRLPGEARLPVGDVDAPPEHQRPPTELDEAAQSGLFEHAQVGERVDVHVAVRVKDPEDDRHGVDPRRCLERGRTVGQGRDGLEGRRRAARVGHDGRPLEVERSDASLPGRREGPREDMLGEDPARPATARAVRGRGAWVRPVGAKRSVQTSSMNRPSSVREKR